MGDITEPPVDQTPAEILRLAAARVREAAKSAIPGPWAAEPDGVGRGYDVWQVDGPHLAFGLRRPDAEWAALVHPGLAEHLAALLDAAADEYALFKGEWSDCPTARLALPVAAMILGMAVADA